MFRPSTQAKPGFRKADVVAATRAIYIDEDQNLETQTKNEEFKVQPYGATTRLFVQEYKPVKFPPPKLYQRPDDKFGALRGTVNEWSMNQERTTKAYRVLKGVLDMETEGKAIQTQFNVQASLALPTGAAAQRAYADLTRISAYFNRNDYVSLIKPDVISLIAAGVTPTISTPLFSAFLAFMRLPDPELEPNRRAKAMVVDLVRRAVLAQNPSFAWSDFTGSPATTTTQQPTTPVSGSVTSPPVTSPPSTGGLFSNLFGG